MSVFYRTMSLLILAITLVTPAITLSSCIGGPVAQQIATSIMTRGADKIINTTYDAQLREAELHTPLKDSPPDPYYEAFITSGFKTITPTAEPLPVIDGTALIKPKDTATSNLSSAQVTRLAHVEVWNLIVGDEKNLVLEKARLLGAEVPPKDQWTHWKVATGAVMTDKSKPITFLIPPEFGRVGSGSRVVVEMTELSQIHVARYASN